MSERETFEDIENSPYSLRIEQAYLHGFMYGTEKGKFSPDELITKGQANVVLCRLVEKICEECTNTAFSKKTSVPECRILMGFAPTKNLYSPVNKNEMCEIAEKIKSFFVTDTETERITFQMFSEKYFGAM